MSTVRTFQPSFSRPMQQRGVALVIVLILLLIMTLLGLASLRGTMMEERMTSSLFDRSLGFQAAEAALRQGELVAATTVTPPTGATCTAGVCGPPTNGLDRSLGNANWTNATALTDNTLAVNNASDLQYLVEYMGEFNSTPKCDTVVDATGKPKDPLCRARIYRVSSRYDAPGRSSVTLQSVIRTPTP